jgi:uncharacterized membrane protein YecN with MAPEG domain
VAPITSLYAALAAILLVVLGMYVIFERGRQKVVFGDGGNPVLIRAVRVHGNATEYVPIALIVMLCLELEHGSPWILHLAGILLLFGRIAHAVGLLRSEKASPGRFLGVVATFAAIVVPAIVLAARVMLFPQALVMHP